MNITSLTTTFSCEIFRKLFALWYDGLLFERKKIRAHLSPMLQVPDGEIDSNDNIQVEPHAMIMVLLACTNNMTSNLYAAITIEKKVLFIP